MRALCTVTSHERDPLATATSNNAVVNFSIVSSITQSLFLGWLSGDEVAADHLFDPRVYSIRTGHIAIESIDLLMRFVHGLFHSKSSGKVTSHQFTSFWRAISRVFADIFVPFAQFPFDIVWSRADILLNV